MSRKVKAALAVVVVLGLSPATVAQAELLESGFVQRPAVTKKVVKKKKSKTRCGTPACNRRLGKQMAAKRGWKGAQWNCLDILWGKRESGWRHTARNPSSSATGIPQALPGSKMRSHGRDWATNPATQVSWGLSYVAGRYGSPCAALAHSYRHGWY